MTKHPQGKAGVNIEVVKYEQIKSAILKTLRKKKSARFEELADAVMEELQSGFDGSIPWYFTTVKLDLEARGVIVRVPGSKPQLLRLKGRS